MTDPQDGRNSEGQFAPGNAIWRVRKCHGRPPVFEDAESLWDACREYFEWAAKPLHTVHDSWTNGYGGVSRVDGSIIEVPARLWTLVVQGENDNALRRAIGGTVGVFTGLPTTQSLRLLETSIKASDGDDVSPVEWLTGPRR